MASDGQGMLDDELGRVIARLEGAVFDPRALADAMQCAGEMLSFDHFCLVHSDLNNLNVVAAEASLAAFQAYETGWGVDSDYRAAAMKTVEPGSLYLDDLAVSDELRRKSPIYNDLFVPTNSAHFAGWRFNVADESWIFSLARSEARGAVTPEEAARLRTLMPYADRALMLALHQRHTRIRGMADYADNLGSPLIVLDHRGRAAAVNRAAERLMSSEFAVRGQRLWAADPESHALLERLALAAQRRGGPGTLQNFMIQSRHGNSRILVKPVTIRGLGLDALPGARVLVTLVETKRPQIVAEDDLRLAFGLSPAEASVAALLAQGKDAQQVADARGVAIGTIRTQIRQLFEKLDVRWLGELISVARNFTSAAETQSEE